MGILNTLDTIVTVMENEKEVMIQSWNQNISSADMIFFLLFPPQILLHIEGIVLQVIGLILQHNVIGELT